ncbi:MAG: adenylate/guanylate cyclase domain-containing protein [Spirochaetales bacterium]|nr:adenylate/guanylate cyclase domain-containing protein [Spirochaetales bacterium]
MIAAAFVLAHLLALLFPALFEEWNGQINDSLFRLRYRVKGPEQVYPYLGHVDITDSMARRLQLSVGDRERFGRVLRVLADAYAGAVVFDIIFPEPTFPANDQALAEATSYAGMAYYPVILLPEEYRRFFDSEPQDSEEDLVAEWLWQPRVLREGRPHRAVRAVPNYPQLMAAAAGIGHINSDPDRDGVHRRFPLLFHYRDGYLPSLTFRVACDYLEVEPERIEVKFGSHILLPQAQLPSGIRRDIRIPIDERGRMIIDLAGPWEDSFAHYSFEKLLQAEFDPALLDALATELEGFLLIVSDLTIKTDDHGPVPLERIYPLSGLHANILNSILTDSFLRDPSWVQAVLTTLALAAVLWALAVAARPLGFTLLALAAYAGFAFLTVWLFAFRGRLAEPMSHSAGFVTALVAVNVQRFVQADRDKTRMRLRFERYFAPQLMSKILRAPEKLMAAERKVLTVLFSDIAGFTSWCTTHTPEQILVTLNEYFDAMTSIVFRNEGTIDKFIGDGLMAFFGDPIEQPDHAHRAVRTAIEMQQQVRRLREQWEPEGRLAIQIRIGINTGEVVVGDLGSRRIVDYTVIGANVNLSQRLESQAPVGGILISEPLYELIKGQFQTRFAGRITAKGISEKFGAYEVVVP